MCFEDGDVVAFMDIQPVNPGHVLVVPREHYESLEDIPHALATHLFDVAMQLAPVVKHVGDADGMNIVVNSGAAAGQDVIPLSRARHPARAEDGFDVPLPFAGIADARPHGARRERRAHHRRVTRSGRSASGS